MKEKMLIWMTEMKDEYVLEASRYKPQKSERRMLEQRAEETGNANKTGYAKEAGTVKKTEKAKVKMKNYHQRKGGRIMMYVSMGLGAAAAAAAICVGSIFWETDPDQPVKPPVTLERTTEAYTTEEEETDMSLGSVIPSEKANTSVGMEIPIEEEERLLIATGEDTLVALDSEGNITSRLEQARLSPQKEVIWQENTWVVSADQPIPVMILEEGKEEEGKRGLYSLREDRWLLEPEYDRMNMLSDSLWTDSEQPFSIGNLIRVDGTVINEKEGLFMRSGDYIYDNTNQNIYDLEGNLLSHYEGMLMEIRGTDVICRDDENQIICQDVSGALLWRQDTSLTYLGHYMGYLNWMDGNGAGIITDMRLNRITDDVQFRQINEEKEFQGRTLQMIAESPDGERKLVRTTNGETGENYTMYYYLCDSDYRILDNYQEILLDLKEQVYLERNEGKRNYSSDWILESGIYGSWEEYDWQDESQPVTRIWRWYVDEPGKLTIKNMWYDETITVDIPDVVPAEVTVNQAGAITIINWKTEDNKCDAVVLASGIIQDIPFPEKEGVDIEGAYGGVKLETLPNGVIRVYDQKTDKGLYYFLADGARLPVDETMEAQYVSPQFQVLRDGSKLYVGDYEGKLTQLPVGMDEE